MVEQCDSALEIVMQYADLMFLDFVGNFGSPEVIMVDIYGDLL